MVQGHVPGQPLLGDSFQLHWFILIIFSLKFCVALIEIGNAFNLA